MSRAMNGRAFLRKIDASVLSAMIDGKQFAKSVRNEKIPLEEIAFRPEAGSVVVFSAVGKQSIEGIGIVSEGPPIESLSRDTKELSKAGCPYSHIFDLRHMKIMASKFFDMLDIARHKAGMVEELQCPDKHLSLIHI